MCQTEDFFSEYENNRPKRNRDAWKKCDVDNLLHGIEETKSSYVTNPWSRRRWGYISDNYLNGTRSTESCIKRYKAYIRNQK